MLVRNDVLTALRKCWYANNKQPVHVRTVHDYFVSHFYKVSPETVPRTLRKLREEGYVVGSNGEFMPIK